LTLLLLPHTLRGHDSTTERQMRRIAHLLVWERQMELFREIYPAA
jgi:hypothetical protein